MKFGGVAKKNYIKMDMDIPARVIGIASNEKIWKICWKINQKMGWNLSTGNEEVALAQTRDLYNDSETDPSFDLSLFDNKLITSKKLPKKATPFRYWLVVRLIGDKEPDIRQYLNELNTIDAVSLAVDLSEVKDIKKLLP